MATVNTHVLLGVPRRYDPGLTPAFVALLHDAGPIIRWQVEHLVSDCTELHQRTVVSALREDAVVALGVALHAAAASPLTSHLGGSKDGFRLELDLEAIGSDAVDDLDEGMRTEQALGLSAVFCLTESSALTERDVESAIGFFSGDVTLMQQAWFQIGTGHDGFGDPGRRFVNPAWRPDLVDA